MPIDVRLVLVWTLTLVICGTLILGALAANTG